MARVAHFEIHTENPERAVEFYSSVFNWQFAKWEGPMDYWMITTGPDEEPGIHGGLVRRHGAGPQTGQAVNAFVCTIMTETLDEDSKKILSLGGQAAVPKMAVPGIGWLAYFHDPDGNIFGVMQNDPDAK